MEPQNTQNTRSGCGALQGEDEAFDLTGRLADVEWQAGVQGGGLQTIRALRATFRQGLTPISPA